MIDGKSISVAEQLRALQKDGNEDEEIGLLAEPPCLQFGGEGFQNLLGGGLIPGTLTEVAGEA